MLINQALKHVSVTSQRLRRISHRQNMSCDWVRLTVKIIHNVNNFTIIIFVDSKIHRIDYERYR